MADWKDDLADAVSNKLTKEQQDAEAFNNKQRVIKERVRAIWDGIGTAISAASAKINQRAGKQLVAPSPPQLELTQQELIQISFMAESPIVGTLIWHLDNDGITMSILGRPSGEREYKFIVAENGEVLLQSNISTVDGEGLAREFMQTLTMQ
jgi:hypothetical protein